MFGFSQPQISSSSSILIRFFSLLYLEFRYEWGPLLKFFFRRLLTSIIACEYFKVGEILPDIRVRVQPIPISICSRLQLFSTRKLEPKIWQHRALFSVPYLSAYYQIFLSIGQIEITMFYLKLFINQFYLQVALLYFHTTL